MHTPADQKPVIRCKEVVKRFGDQTVLKGVTFDVYPGETMVIMGGSGSGKSTMLRTMIGTHTLDGGSIELFGQSLCGISEENLNEVRKKFGILFQSGALFNSMTLAENVALPLQEHTDLDQEIIDIQVKIKLELVGLREHADKYPAQISGGMKKRAGLARALALDPKILFYDEPSAGLDPVTSAQIDQLILALTKQLGVTSVVVTHEMDSAFTIADRMAMLDQGRMLCVEDRSWFENLRDMPSEEARTMDEDSRLVRQFLRGDADGPLAARRDEEGYSADLFGMTPDRVTRTPSVEPTRG
ncbi:MAG: ABC transporter ATP-binding protein [Phycisphaerales bacterium]|nr:ABC transporter ATP-binding protein [Phycisphaerales bacterium]